jgi:hypothetical protein
MAGVRRSGRISKEVPIILLGTDTSGRVFSEETHTLVLSLHGAGIRSSARFAPDEVLMMRLADSGREAEIRLVGHLGEDPRGSVYGVAFCDPNLDFWQIEFPLPLEPRLSGVDLKCCFCNEIVHVQPTEIEFDVFLASQTVLRYCEPCGQTTAWKKSTGAPPPPRVRAAPVPASPQEPTPAIAAITPAILSATAPAKSSYAAASIALDDIVPTALLPPPPVATSVTAKETAASSTTLTQPKFAAGGKPNLRLHVRTRVHFTACVRLNPGSEEIVECDNISKGGFSFRSLKRYDEFASIEVAVPYYLGHPPIFVRATIRRIEELPALNLFRYGVAFA